MNLPDDWKTDSVHVDGVSLQYYRTGEGPPLVMAHGFTDNGRCWEPLVEDLADDYDVVTYDARAHGVSDAPETGYGPRDRVADLVGLLDALDLSDPILLGHSMGGSTVASAAAMHPDLPRAVVLEDPACMLDIPESGPDERANEVRNAVREWSEKGVDTIADEYRDERPDLARRLAVARTECRPAIAEITRTGFGAAAEIFPDITAPTLVLKADADPETRAEHLDTASTLVDGRLVHVPGAGHCIFRDQYDAGLAELRAFLRRV
ncbi:alpha/beta fold hydrolase [Haloferax larsenii]|uniref:Pimeloyl-ACP methyl ester carboxylesterase n=1 Tax=Haloferax larsenii TaxID=302484 RepID=A0A1H7S317_HALLR|nr:alpha/beta hydrolase [Haloferax larsenii]SEL66679.1 Pimeloyl-ACP methyl ester carboxylesterase [Haloferax larsenii]